MGESSALLVLTLKLFELPFALSSFSSSSCEFHHPKRDLGSIAFLENGNDAVWSLVEVGLPRLLVLSVAGDFALDGDRSGLNGAAIGAIPPPACGIFTMRCENPDLELFQL